MEKEQQISESQQHLNWSVVQIEKAHGMYWHPGWEPFILQFVAIYYGNSRNVSFSPCNSVKCDIQSVIKNLIDAIMAYTLSSVNRNDDSFDFSKRTGEPRYILLQDFTDAYNIY